MIDRKRIEEVFGSGSKARAARIQGRIELGRRILARLETGRVIHYDIQILINAVDKLFDGKGLLLNEHKAWERYKDLKL